MATKRYGLFAYKPDINARVAGSDAKLAREAAAAIAKRELRQREQQLDEQRIADHIPEGFLLAQAKETK